MTEDEKNYRRALTLFARHTVTRDVTPYACIWTLHPPAAGFSAVQRVQVVAGVGGMLTVFGDIDTVSFGSKSGGPEGRIYWFGDAPSWGYLTQKAKIGGTEDVYTFDDRIAMDWVLDMRRHGYLDAETAREAYDSLRYGDISTFGQFVDALGPAALETDPTERSVSRVSFRVISALAAIRRCCEVTDQVDALAEGLRALCQGES